MREDDQALRYLYSKVYITARGLSHGFCSPENRSLIRKKLDFQTQSGHSITSSKLHTSTFQVWNCKLEKILCNVRNLSVYFFRLGQSKTSTINLMQS